MAPVLRRTAGVILPLGFLLQACGDGTGPGETPPPVAEVSTTPEFATVNVGENVLLSAAAMDDDGDRILDAEIAWNTLSAAVAVPTSLGSTAAVNGVAPGVTRITASSGVANDTTWIAVLGPTSLLSTSFIHGAPGAVVTPGQTVTVSIALDLSRVSPTGDLGSVVGHLRYEPSILVYEGAAPGLGGTTNLSVPTPGTFRFTFSGTQAQGTPDLAIAHVTFRVAPDAPRNGYMLLVLNYTAQPTSTSGQPYPIPVSVWGRVRVAP